MTPIFKLRNAIQPYAWGSKTSLAELLGQSVPTAEPQAELWMGAHPKAPSKIWFCEEWQGLDTLIGQNPVFFLGEATAERFSNRFPFLFKVLAVEQPLSIQAHPDADQARRGFQHENEMGIELSAPQRNYRDDQAKPECVCALSAFTALCGFRPALDTFARLRPVWPLHFSDQLRVLIQGPERSALRTFFLELMTYPQARLHELVAAVVEKANMLSDQDPIYEWMVRLQRLYFGDIGVLSPGFLNLIILNKGEALFLPPGQLHAYLKGMAVEVMANSDNVLRGGLTPKHVDTKELMKVADFSARQVRVLSPINTHNGWRRFDLETEAFSLSVTSINPQESICCKQNLNGPQIILCTQGVAQIFWSGANIPMRLAQGESVLLTPSMPDYQISGEAILYKASIGS